MSLFSRIVRIMFVYAMEAAIFAFAFVSSLHGDMGTVVEMAQNEQNGRTKSKKRNVIKG